MHNDLPPLEEMLEELSKTGGGQCFLAWVLPAITAFGAVTERHDEEAIKEPLRNPYDQA
jgi:hypothetical protein